MASKLNHFPTSKMLSVRENEQVQMKFTFLIPFFKVSRRAKVVGMHLKRRAAVDAVRGGSIKLLSCLNFKYQQDFLRTMSCFCFFKFVLLYVRKSH